MYVTLAQLADRPGARELAQLVSDAMQGAVVDPALFDATLRGADRSAYSPAEIAAADAAAARVVEAVEDATARIDGFLGQRGYQLPLSPVPRIVAGWCRDITHYLLSGSRPTDDRSDPIVRGYRDAMRLLEQLAAGKFSLGGDDPMAVGQADLAVEVSGRTRIFSRDSLGRL